MEDKVGIPTFVVFFFLQHFLQRLYVGMIIHSGPSESHSARDNPTVTFKHYSNFCILASW